MQLIHHVLTEVIDYNKPQTVTLSPGTNVTFELLVSPRDTIRYMMNAENGTQLFVRRSDQTEQENVVCQLYGFVNYESTEQKLFKNDSTELFTVVFTITSTTTQKAYFMAHAAIELEEFTTFYEQNSLKTHFKTRRDNSMRLFAFFSGSAEDQATSILFNCTESVVIAWDFQSYSPISNLFPHMNSNFSTQVDKSMYNIQYSFVYQTPGWMYLSVTTTADFNISVSESKNHTLLVNNTYVIPTYPLQEAIVVRAIKINKTDLLKIKSNISVIAFSDDPSTYHDISIDLGVNERPSMLYYDTTGISSWTKCTNSGAGIAEITNDEIITCNNVSDFCIINVVLNLQTDKYMSKNPVFYSKENITIIVGFNHTAMLNYRQSYQLNESNGYLNNMVYNANGLNEDRITNTLSIGYVFQTTYTCEQTSTIINLNNDTINNQGFHLRTYYGLDQIIVSQSLNRKYYQKDGIYFIESMTSIQKPCGMVLTVLPTFEMQYPNKALVHGFGQGQANFFENIRGYNSFSACFVIDGSKIGGLDENSFTIYSSFSYMVPDRSQPQTFSRTSKLHKQGSKYYYCIDTYREKADGDWVYFSIYNNSAQPEDLGASFQVGEIFYYVSDLRIKSSVDKKFLDQHILYKLKPDNSSLQGRSAAHRLSSLFLDFKTGAPADLDIDFIDPFLNSSIKKHRVRKDTKSVSLDFDCPYDRTVLVNFSYYATQDVWIQAYFDHIYTEQEVAVFKTTRPTIYRFHVREHHEYGLFFVIPNTDKQENISLSKNVAMYICKNKPQLSQYDEYKDPSCFQKSLNDFNQDSFVFGPDTNLTTSNQTEQIKEYGYYYVTFVGLDRVDVLMQAEVREITLLNLNRDNRLHLRKPQPSGRLNESQYSWFILDVLSWIKITGNGSYFYANFSKIIEAICVTYDKPVDYYTYSKNPSVCVGLNKSTQFVQIDVSTLSQYKRFFIHLKIEDYVSLDSVFVSVLQTFSSTTQTFQDFKLRPLLKNERFSPNEQLFYFNGSVTESYHILLQPRDYLSNTDFQKDFEKGNQGMAVMHVSHEYYPTFQNGFTDSTGAILAIHFWPQLNSKFFVRVRATKNLTTEFTFRFELFNDSSDKMNELYFGMPYQVIGESKNNTRYFFKTLKAPLYLFVDPCEAKENTTVDTYFNWFNTNVGSSSFIDNFSSAATHSTHMQFPDINLHNKSIYQNINTFIGFNSTIQQDPYPFSYEVLINSYSGKPIIPKNTETLLTKSGSKYKLKLRTARRPVSDDIDGHLQINFNVAFSAQMKLRYQVYHIPNMTGVIMTPCSIRSRGKIVFNDTVEYKANGQQTLEFKLDGDISQDSFFVALVIDPPLGSSSVYPAISWQDAASDRATVNMWAWIGGSIAAVFIIAAIVFAVWLIMKYRKPNNNIYQNLVERPADMF